MEWTAASHSINLLQSSCNSYLNKDFAGCATRPKPFILSFRVHLMPLIVKLLHTWLHKVWCMQGWGGAEKGNFPLSFFGRSSHPRFGSNRNVEWGVNDCYGTLLRKWLPEIYSEKTITRISHFELGEMITPIWWQKGNNVLPASVWFSQQN